MEFNIRSFGDGKIHDIKRVLTAAAAMSNDPDTKVGDYWQCEPCDLSDDCCLLLKTEEGIALITQWSVIATDVNNCKCTHSN